MICVRDVCGKAVPNKAAEMTAQSLTRLSREIRQLYAINQLWTKTSKNDLRRKLHGVMVVPIYLKRFTNEMLYAEQVFHVADSGGMNFKHSKLVKLVFKSIHFISLFGALYLIIILGKRKTW